MRRVAAAACWRLSAASRSVAWALQKKGSTQQLQGRTWKTCRRYAMASAMVIGGLGALSVADPMYILWKASRCDLPEKSAIAYEIPRENEVKKLTEVMDSNSKSFIVLSGPSGVGKTEAVLEAARQRGTGVLYIDGATSSTADKVIELIVEKYKSPIPSLWDIVRRPSGWSTLTEAADWYFWRKQSTKQRQLVVVIDHIDSVTGAEKLLDLAKVAAEERKLRIIFVASGGIPHLRKESAFRKGAMEVLLDPVPMKSMKDLLKEVAPDRKGEWDEIVYLSGCNLWSLWYYIDGLQLGYSLGRLQRTKMFNLPSIVRPVDAEEVLDPAFWKCLLEAGAHGLELPASLEKLAGILSHGCCRIEGNRVYFSDGMCIDSYARLLKFRLPQRKYEAFASNAEQPGR